MNDYYTHYYYYHITHACDDLFFSPLHFSGGFVYVRFLKYQIVQIFFIHYAHLAKHFIYTPKSIDIEIVESCKTRELGRIIVYI